MSSFSQNNAGVDIILTKAESVWSENTMAAQALCEVVIYFDVHAIQLGFQIRDWSLGPLAIDDIVVPSHLSILQVGHLVVVL